VPIPVFAASELREVAFAESLRRHVSSSFVDVAAPAAAREATGTAAREQGQRSREEEGRFSGVSCRCALSVGPAVIRELEKGGLLCLRLFLLGVA
jgi:hypothetical protein